MLSSSEDIDENSKRNDEVRQSPSIDLGKQSKRVSSKDPGEIDSKGKQITETNVIHGEENIIQTVKLTHQDCENRFDVYCDRNGPSVLFNTPTYRELYSRIKDKGARVRFLVDITLDNLDYCKQIERLFDAEVKHLDGVSGNFAIIDDKWYVASPALEENKPIPELICSNVKSVIKQNQFIFEILWKKSTPAEKRIKEIEEGFMPVETRIVDNPREIYSLILDITSQSNNGLSNCSTIGGFQMIYEDKNLFNAYVNLLSLYKEGKANRGVRWVTHLENDNDQIALINKFLDIGVEIRHTNNLLPMSFALSDKQFQGTIEKMENGEKFTAVLHSTEPLYIEHFQSFFEHLWNSAMDVRERIRQIESGIAPEMTQIIEDSKESRKLLLQILENAENEILLVYPSSKAVDLQKRIGAMDILSKKCQQGLKIRIVSPQNVNLDKLICQPHYKSGSQTSADIIIREILKQQDFKPTILMIDRKSVLILELKNDTSTSFEEATGLTTYSISNPTVISYISIFDSFWEQTEMAIRLGLANERLIQNEEMEREFINTAAHELRTPTQAIMGYTEIDAEVFKDLLENTKVTVDDDLHRTISHLKKHFDTISKNASRLDELINNLLDVARIESSITHSLQLQKERLNLVSEINECLKTQLDQKIKTKNITIHFINRILDDQQCWVYADRSRLNQILVNLIDNAIKFSPANSVIDIIIKDNDYDFSKENDGSELDKSENSLINSQILVGISDMGKGISPSIMPRLFEKFVTDSDTGTGLGLFITKNIVVAHGGRIWAYDNQDGIGSTFVFSLPKVRNTTVNNN